MASGISGSTAASAHASTPSVNIVVTREDQRIITDVATRSVEVSCKTTADYVKSLPTSILLDKGARVCAYACSGAMIGAGIGSK